jgi:hypothetical protein
MGEKAADIYYIFVAEIRKEVGHLESQTLGKGTNREKLLPDRIADYGDI